MREVLLRFEGVTVRRGAHVVLEDLSFELEAGELLGVIGPNGAGKTTLLRCALGLLPIDAGRIEVLGRPPGPAAGGRGIGYVPQRERIPVGFPATVRDVVAMGRLRPGRPFRRPDASDRLEVERALGRVGIAELGDRPVGRLSGGQQRRVLLAQALCASQRLLLLDEPTVGLDLPAEHEFYRLLRELRGELGLGIACVSHDLVALAGAADRLLCINRRMHIHGNPEEVIHSHAIEEAYSCEFDFLAAELRTHKRED